MKSVDEEVLDMISRDIGIPVDVLRGILDLEEMMEERKTRVETSTLTEKPKPINKLEYTEEEKRAKKDETMVHAITLHVDCEKTSEDPDPSIAYTGYDFTVEITLADEAIELIEKACKEFNKPFIQVREGREKAAKRKETHTKTDIQKTIKSGY